jgi:hypothetical protein
MLIRFAIATYAKALPAGLAAALVALAPGAVLAQGSMPSSTNTDQTLAPPRLVPIPLNAKRAVMTFNGSQFVLIDDKKAQMAPGVRIFGADNMLKTYGSLVGKATAKYQVEQTTGMLMNVWILTDREILTPDPKPDPVPATTTITNPAR